MLSSQPQALAVLRDKLEARYQADEGSNGQDTSLLQKEGVDLWMALMKAKESRQPRAEKDTEGEEKESLQGWSLLETHYSTDSLQSNDSKDKLEASNLLVRYLRRYSSHL